MSLDISALPHGKSFWAVADLGDVIYHPSQEVIENEFPTQHHVVVIYNGDNLYLANDNLTITARFYKVTNVDLAVLASTDMLLAVENMESGED